MCGLRTRSSTARPLGVDLRRARRRGPLARRRPALAVVRGRVLGAPLRRRGRCARVAGPARAQRRPACRRPADRGQAAQAGRLRRGARAPRGADVARRPGLAPARGRPNASLPRSGSPALRVAVAPLRCARLRKPARAARRPPRRRAAGVRARGSADAALPPRPCEPALLGGPAVAAGAQPRDRSAGAVTEVVAPARRVRRLFVGRPMRTGQLDETLLPKTLALPIFASDPLSSVAYATESALVVLLAVSAASAYLVFPISIAIAALLAVVVVSYMQTVRAYETSGGAYIVARENLGTVPSLVAAAALLTDYVLTVAVSISAVIS